MNLKKVLEYRASFFLQALAMLVSNIGFILIAYFFIKRFGLYAGLDFREYLIFFDVILFIYSFLHIFFGGYNAISDGVVNGKLDNYILMPGSLLLKLVCSSIPTSIFGDFINALIIPFFIPGFGFFDFVLMVYCTFIGSLILLGFIVIMQSMSFFLGGSKEISRASFELILGSGSYPQQIYEGTFFKLIFLTIIPVFYAFYFPFNLILKFDLRDFFVLHLVAAIFIFLGKFIFKKGLKRYESGNLLNTNQ